MTPPPGAPLQRRQFVMPTVAEVLPRRDDSGGRAPEPRAQTPTPARHRATLLNRPVAMRRLAA